MAVVPIISQTWDTTSVFNPTRMNNIETNIATVSNATGVKYDNNNSVKDMIEISSITISERNNNVNILNAFRIGKLVVLDFYNGSGNISANEVWFRVDESARPSNDKYTMDWLLTDASTYGSKSFTIDTDGRIKCNANVFRGGAKLIYTL